MKNSARAWTAHDIRRLTDALDEGLSPERIAEKLHRTVSAVHSKAHKLGRKFKTVAERRGKVKLTAVPVAVIPSGSDGEVRLAALFRAKR